MAVGDIWAIQFGTTTSGNVRPSSGVEVCLTFMQHAYYDSNNFANAYPSHLSAGTYPLIGAIWYGNKYSPQLQSNYTGTDGHTHGATMRMTYPLTNAYYIAAQKGYGTGSPYGSDYRAIITKE